MTKTLTMMVMDPPYEAASTTTALRIVDSALRKGHNVNVFAFEGGVSLTMAGQKPHPNPVHQTSVEEENHPTTRAFIASLFELAKERGVKLDWVNCGFCVDERGADDWIAGPRRGGPPDFYKMLNESNATIMIPTK
jgi:tRNA 2-thiouridine synthesizing protein D